MTEYITREAALMAVCRADLPDKTEDGTPILNGKRKVSDCVRRIKAIPAANVRPVVRGKWNRTDAYPHRLYCSVCYETYLKNDELLERWEFPLNFCPNCGADMMEES